MFTLNFRSPSLWAGIVSGGISQYQHTKALRAGHLNKSEYAAHTTKNITGAAGIVAGIEYGAMLGTSVMPGVGTVVGSIIGGFVGDRIGSAIGLQAGNMLFNRPQENSLLGTASHQLLQQPITGLMQSEQHEQVLQ